MGMRSSSALNLPPSIEIHIEELILHGFAANDRLHIGAAIEQELSRLIERQGTQALPRSSVNLERLAAGSFRLANNANSQTVGQHIARHVYHQLSSMNINPAAANKRSALKAVNT